MISIGWTFVFTIVNVVILFVALRAFLFKPVTNFMQQRTAKIKAALDEAEEARAKAQELRDQSDLVIWDAASQADLIINSAKLKADEFHTSSLAKTREEVETFLANGRKRIEAETAEAAAALRQETASLAATVANRLLEKGGDPSEAERMTRAAFEEIGKA